MRPAFSLALLCLMGTLLGIFLWPRLDDRQETAREQNFVRKTAVPPAVTPEQLVREVETVRGLRFKRPPAIVAVTGPEIEKAVRSAWEQEYPAPMADSRMRTAMALGLTREVFNLTACLTGLTMEQPAAWYDENDNRLLFDQSLDLASRPDLRGRVVFEIARALALQYASDSLTHRPPAGDDAILSGENVISGDATIVQTRHRLSFPESAAIARPPPETVGFYEAPPFLRAWFLFGTGMAEIFQSEMISAAPAGKGANAVLDGILARPPRTTAEIMHPELFSSGSFVPESVALPSTTVLGVAPIADYALGEYVTLLVLKSQLAQEQSRKAAAGWKGDRCLVFPGNGTGEIRDHLFWRTRWATTDDAKEFLAAIRVVLLHRNALLPETRYDLPENGLAVSESAVSLRATLTKDGRGVNVLSSPDAGFLKRMEAQFPE